MGLTTAQLGFVQGTVGVIGLTIGGILGGVAAARGGLKNGFGPWLPQFQSLIPFTYT